MGGRKSACLHSRTFKKHKKRRISQKARVVYRSNNNANANGGVSYANANNDSANVNANIGSRLANNKVFGLVEILAYNGKDVSLMWCQWE